MIVSALPLVLLLLIFPTLGLARYTKDPKQHRASSNNIKVDRARQLTSLKNARAREISHLRARFKTRLL